MIPLTSAELHIFHPGNRTVDDPDRTISATTGDIKSFEVSHRLGEVLAEASVSLHNHDGTYTATGRGRAFGEGDFGSGPFGGTLEESREGAIRIGDRVRIDFELGASGVYGDEYGSTEYGSAPVPPSWTGVVEPIETTRKTAGTADLSFDATDFAGGILSYRTITDHYDNRDVGYIVRDICSRKAPEIDTDPINDFGVTTDISYSAKNCWEAVKELAALADAVPRHSGRELHIDAVGNLPFAFEVGARDILLPLKSKQTPDQLHNIVRVEAGRAQFLEVDRNTFDSWTRVTDSSRETIQVRARKARIERVEVYVQTDGTAENGIKVRLQADEGGAPVAPSDPDSDIMRGVSKDVEELPDTEGWVAFQLEDHILPDRGPWILIEGEGATGHDIGLQSDGDPMLKTTYSAPRNYEVNNNESIRKYRARQKQIERDNLTTLGATRDAAEMELRRRSWPRETISFGARSRRAHALKPGDLIDIWRSRDGAYGRYVVVERDISVDVSSNPVNLKTELTAMSRDGLLAR